MGCSNSEAADALIVRGHNSAGPICLFYFLRESGQLSIVSTHWIELHSSLIPPVLPWNPWIATNRYDATLTNPHSTIWGRASCCWHLWRLFSVCFRLFLYDYAPFQDFRRRTLVSSPWVNVLEAPGLSVWCDSRGECPIISLSAVSCRVVADDDDVATEFVRAGKLYCRIRISKLIQCAYGVVSEY